MTPDAFRKLCMALPGTNEEPHFDRTSFRVKKKIFATMKVVEGKASEAMIRVQPVDKCLAIIDSDKETFFDYGGYTTRNGALGVRLAKVKTAMAKELLHEAWERIVTKK